MKRIAAVLSLAAVASVPAVAGAETLHARLSGYQEVPAVSTAAAGAFRAKVNEAAGTIDYELSYEALQGTVLMSHIHVAQPGVNGGISVWLCQTAASPAPAAVAAVTPVCPQGGSVSGLITAAEVIGPGGANPATSQLIEPGELGELIAAIRAGVGYVNVHTTVKPSGEIRGQIRR